MFSRSERVSRTSSSFCTRIGSAASMAFWTLVWIIRLMERMTPKPTEKARNDDAPWLIIGRVWPVCGTRWTLIAMCMNAWQEMVSTRPARTTFA